MDPVRERLGVFGGTFDPPHIGHLIAGLYCFRALSLDRVLFVISGEPWQKVGTRPISAVEDRVALVRAAIAGRSEFEVSLVDVERQGPSYTVDTLADLRRRHPDAELWLIVGADAAAGIPTWHEADRLPSLAKLAVVNRPATLPLCVGEDDGREDDSDVTRTDRRAVEGPEGALLDRFERRDVAIPALDISSSELRRRVRDGEPIDWLVTDGVRSLITERLLYRDGR